jgi:hypothetical protein
MSKKVDNEKYLTESEIIKRALATKGHKFDSLIENMKKEKIGCLYLSGTRTDNDFCFGSDKLGFAISILPEDWEKSSVQGIHPESNEINLVIGGKVTFGQILNGQTIEKTLEAGQHIEHRKGTCHWVKSFEGDSIIIILKTYLNKEPKVIRCAMCPNDSCDHRKK